MLQAISFLRGIPISFLIEFFSCCSFHLSKNLKKAFFGLNCGIYLLLNLEPYFKSLYLDHRKALIPIIKSNIFVLGRVSLSKDRWSLKFLQFLLGNYFRGFQPKFFKRGSAPKKNNFLSPLGKKVPRKRGI